MSTILIIEDDPDMAVGLRDNLQFDAHEVWHAPSGEEGLALLGEKRPDLVLLDVMLPGIDGFEVCRRIRGQGLSTPVIMLTARGQELDVVRGLELGADDYVTKPFGVRELLARINAALRRAGAPAADGASLRVGDATIDLARGRVIREEQTHVLGHYEIEILRLLMERSEQNVSRAAMIQAIWGDAALSTDRTVDNHIVSLRRKIEPDPRHPRHILTVHGIGYKFVP